MPDFNKNKGYPKVIFDERIDVKPWQECTENNCQHPECIEKRKLIKEIKERELISIYSKNSSKRRTARKKIERIRKRNRIK